jgi:hypothetical protein
VAWPREGGILDLDGGSEKIEEKTLPTDVFSLK